MLNSEGVIRNEYSFRHVYQHIIEPNSLEQPETTFRWECLFWAARCDDFITNHYCFPVFRWEKDISAFQDNVAMIIVPGMIIPIPPELIDQVFLYITMYLALFINPASYIFSPNPIFYVLSFFFFTICLVTIVLKSIREDAQTYLILSMIPVLNIIPMIRIPGWPLGSIVILIISMMALPIHYYYIFNSHKFTDIYYDIYIIATAIFIVNWTWLWCDISYSIGKHKWIGIFVMVPILNIFILLYLAFGKGRRKKSFFMRPDEEERAVRRESMPKLR